jgi:hypothetical protein
VERQLHKRRRAIAADGASKNGNLRDPYPDPYTFRFRKDLTLGAVSTIYFINPGARCQSGTTSFGTIEITGNNTTDPF